MKLVFKLTLLYLLISLIVFMIGYTITYEVIKREIDFEQRRFLRERLASVERMIERRGLHKRFERNNILIIPLDTGNIPYDTTFIYSDTLVMHESLQRMEPHIKLEVNKKIGDRYYSISLYDIIIEEDDIEEGVRESLIKLYILLIIMVLLLAAIASYFLLKPFNKTLKKIKTLDIREPEFVHFEKTNTKEFQKLNVFLSEMIQKMKSDYRALKEFTENASHEMQTPIAVATGKLELLLSGEKLDDEQIALVNSAQDSIRRLSKLGNALALLTKIDNREFQNIEDVDLSALLEQLIFDFKELMELKNLDMHKYITESAYVKIDPTLAAVLCTNLLQNAIRHNYYGGEISVSVDKRKLTVQNTGKDLKIDPEQLFARFKKDQDNRESLGLGLAIVKKICEINNFDIEYAFKDQRHIFSIVF
ncbi:MAG: sensor histidine kinase [Candidatus Cyclobacteriaceae bacterium M2_1C_046]